MNVAEIIKAIQAAAALSQSLAGLANELREGMASKDKDELAQALRDLAESNDQLHKRVQEKLRS